MTGITKNHSLALKAHKAMLALMDATDGLRAALDEVENLPIVLPGDTDIHNVIEKSWDILGHNAPLLVLSLQAVALNLATKEQVIDFNAALLARNLNSPCKAVREGTRAGEGMPPEEATTGTRH